MRERILLASIVSLLLAAAGFADTNPPVPIFQETSLPPAVTLPAPKQQLPDMPNRPLTVVEAVQIALVHQPSIMVAAAQVNAATAQLAQTHAKLGPNLVIGTGYTGDLFTAGVGANTEEGYQFSATINQLLFDFNHTRDLVRQSIASQLVAKDALTQAQSDLVYQTKEAFYTYAEDLQLIKVNEENVKDSQGHLDFAKAEFANKIGLLSDVVTAETAVSAAIFNLNLAHNTASLAQVSLAQLMGIDPRTPIQVADSEEPSAPTADISPLIDSALKNRPEVLQAQANLQSLQYALSAAKNGNSPTVAGVLAWGQHGVAPSMSADQTLGLGVSISWSPYDSGLSKGRVDQAKANIVIAQAQLSTAKQTVISDVSQAYLNLMTAMQRVTTAQAEVTNAQEALKLAEGRFKAGVGVFLDVLDDENALTTALTNQVNANTTVQLSRAAFAHAVYEDLIVRSLVTK